MSAAPCDIGRQEGLYRFVHPLNSNPDGTLNSGTFSLRRDSEISLGVESIVRSISFARFCDLKPAQGVARVLVGDVLDLQLSVILAAEPEWIEFADAHAVLTGYSAWPNRRKDEIARRLRDLANQEIVKPAPRADPNI